MDDTINIKDGVIKALEQTFIFIEPNELDNVDLSQYIEDSIQFMSFIVNLEDIFSVEFPPELLLLDNFIHPKDIYVLIGELTINSL